MRPVFVDDRAGSSGTHVVDKPDATAEGYVNVREAGGNPARSRHCNRAGRLGPRGIAALLAGAALVVLFLVPQIKYPANPSSIGDPETIRERTALYFGMIACSIAAAIATLLIGLRLRSRLGAWDAALFAGALYIAAVTSVMFVLPTVNEVPEHFPATLLWQFRSHHWVGTSCGSAPWA